MQTYAAYSLSPGIVLQCYIQYSLEIISFSDKTSKFNMKITIKTWMIVFYVSIGLVIIYATNNKKMRQNTCI